MGSGGRSRRAGNSGSSILPSRYWWTVGVVRRALRVGNLRWKGLVVLSAYLFLHVHAHAGGYGTCAPARRKAADPSPGVAAWTGSWGDRLMSMRRNATRARTARASLIRKRGTGGRSAARRGEGGEEETDGELTAATRFSKKMIIAALLCHVWAGETQGRFDGEAAEEHDMPPVGHGEDRPGPGARGRRLAISRPLTWIAYSFRRNLREGAAPRASSSSSSGPTSARRHRCLPGSPNRRG